MVVAVTFVVADLFLPADTVVVTVALVVAELRLAVGARVATLACALPPAVVRSVRARAAVVTRDALTRTPLNGRLTVGAFVAQRTVTRVGGHCVLTGALLVAVT